MTITKRDNRWFDENNNSWDSEEEATLYSPTLTDCTSCFNCYSCIDCSSCIDCRDCSYCSSCIGCNDWTNNMKYEPVIRPFIDCTNRLLEPDL